MMLLSSASALLLILAIHLVAEVSANGKSTTSHPLHEYGKDLTRAVSVVDPNSLVSAHKARASKRPGRRLKRGGRHRRCHVRKVVNDAATTKASPRQTSDTASPTVLAEEALIVTGDSGIWETASASWSDETITTTQGDGWTDPAAETSTSRVSHYSKTSTDGSAPAASTSTSGQSGQSGRSGYPFSSITFDTSIPYKAPSTPLNEWWSSSFYGFLGFSYPLEDSSCPSASDLSVQFAAMKQDFGASMVRIYAPGCRDASLWEVLIDAAVENSMAVIFQIWWGFDDDQPMWKNSMESLKTVLSSEDYGAIAPYVVHSVEFGSEPIGDEVDGGPDGGFLDDLANFKAEINAYGIPVGISEDWDRPGTMSSNDGTGLGPIGEEVLARSDLVHAHIMPYYHGLDFTDSWGYVESQLAWFHGEIPSSVPVLISESMWAWGVNSEHEGGQNDVGSSQYTSYWKMFDDNCELFAQYNVGWFIHTWQGEGTFDMAPNGGGGGYEVSGWRPREC